MDFSYRPIVQIQVFAGTDTRIIPGLVDSGTEISMISAEIAESLRIDSRKCKKAIAGGVGGDKPAFVSKVTFVVEGFDKPITSNVLFVEDLLFPALLGQDDFFRNFDVRFEKRVNSFYLKAAA